jgi:hypothetical protein
MNQDHIKAQEHSLGNKAEIQASQECGCFYCMHIFSGSEVTEWIDQGKPFGETALCPDCGLDTVIGSNSGYPITKGFLYKMHEKWFG